MVIGYVTSDELNSDEIVKVTKDISNSLQGCKTNFPILSWDLTAKESIIEHLEELEKALIYSAY